MAKFPEIVEAYLGWILPWCTRVRISAWMDEMEKRVSDKRLVY
jgi:hypothetical protein